MEPQRDEFESLRRLLAVKRYEQPPPGYFHTLSHRVTARLRAGETRREPGLLGWFSEKLSQAQQLWSSLEARPAVAGAFGFAVCGFMASGFYFSDNALTASAMESTSTLDTPVASIVLTGHRDTNTASVVRSRSSSLFEEMRHSRTTVHPQLVGLRSSR
jgi:hypothetical protein